MQRFVVTDVNGNSCLSNLCKSFMLLGRPRNFFLHYMGCVVGELYGGGCSLERSSSLLIKNSSHNIFFFLLFPCNLPFFQEEKSTQRRETRNRGNLWHENFFFDIKTHTHRCGGSLLDTKVHKKCCFWVGYSPYN